MSSETNPVEFAQLLLSRLNAKHPVNLQAIARALRLRIRGVNATGFLGAMFPNENCAGGIIAVNGNIRENGRQRFTIAHEIGHYVLPTPTGTPSVCSTLEIGLPWNGSDHNFERAVNEFAAELLLPREKVQAIVRKYPVTFETAELVKEKFKVSLTAAAFRCVELTDIECALVTSVNGIVEHYQPSDSWQYRISTSRQVGRNTLARKLMDDITVLKVQGKVPARAWANESKYVNPAAQLMEESVCMYRYNTVLSFLTTAV